MKPVGAPVMSDGLSLIVQFLDALDDLGAWPGNRSGGGRRIRQSRKFSIRLRRKQGFDRDRVDSTRIGDFVAGSNQLAQHGALAHDLGVATRLMFTADGVLAASSPR